ncbi:unnamed protein product [Ostreobium quekettii]|uniref:Uncharacterized protein n=1 Tax=Ostreobium quekettii TaxID=121088 RepID=A0A8S1J1D5_9CHLO|nr:unnamed protein product [Ostreobium quekettii]
MTLACLVALLAAALALGAARGQQAVCPPPEFDAVKGLDVRKFATAPWFSQAQMPLSFNPADQFYCVRARYQLNDQDDLTAGIKVLFYANEGRVNGPVVSTAKGSTHVEQSGNITDLEEPSKFDVLPTNLQTIFRKTLLRFFFPDHWVVAVGPSKNRTLAYDWAIVSAGPPKTPGKAGCRTDISFLGLFQVHQGGLWLLTRKPVDPVGTSIMRNVAEAMGFDLTVLGDVQQAECKYIGAP